MAYELTEKFLKINNMLFKKDIISGVFCTKTMNPGICFLNDEVRNVPTIEADNLIICVNNENINIDSKHQEGYRPLFNYFTEDVKKISEWLILDK